MRKGNNIKKTIIDIKALSLQLNKIITQHEVSFLKSFCKNWENAEDLSNVSYCLKGVSFKYLGYNGYHKDATISWEMFEYWLDELKEDGNL